MRSVIIISLACAISAVRGYTTHNSSVWVDYESVQKDPIGKGTRGVAHLVRLKDEPSSPVLVAKIYEPKSVRGVKEVETALARELPIQSMVNSSFVPKIYRLYHEERHWAIVMDYAGPVTLEKIWKNVAKEIQYKHNHALLRFITANLLKAVHDLHNQNVAHGDLYMYNVGVSADGYLNLFDFDKAMVDPHFWIIGRDVKHLGRFVYRLYAVNPETSLFPLSTEIYNRFASRSAPGSLEEFLAWTARPASVGELMKHPYLHGFDWKSLSSRTLRSPLRSFSLV